MPGVGACWGVARRMLRMVRERQLDIVEFPNWEGLGVLFQQFSRVPIIVRLYTSSLESQVIDGLAPTREQHWDVRRERWQSHWADAIVTHSLAHRLAMANELGLPPQRIRIIPLGVRVFPDFRRPPSRRSSPIVRTHWQRSSTLSRRTNTRSIPARRISG